MGHVSILLDKMRLDEMGLDEMGINRSNQVLMWTGFCMVVWRFWPVVYQQKVIPTALCRHNTSVMEEREFY